MDVLGSLHIHLGDHQPVVGQFLLHPGPDGAVFVAVDVGVFEELAAGDHGVEDLVGHEVIVHAGTVLRRAAGAVVAETEKTDPGKAA